MDKIILLRGIYTRNKINKKKAASLALILMLTFGIFGSLGGPGQDHNMYGAAYEGISPPGTLVANGEEVSGWIDGVCYGQAIITLDMFDLYIAGDTWGFPNDDVVKDGGYDGDTIMYYLNYNPMDYYLNVSHTTSTFEEGSYENDPTMFFNRTDLAPGLNTLRMLKINEIVLDPEDGLSQYIIIYDPGQHIGMNNITDYYLQKDNNVSHTVEGEKFNFSIHSDDIIDMANGYYYINLTSDLSLDNSDELKLIWNSPYNPSIDPTMTGPGNGEDIVVDRVEWGNYSNYIDTGVSPPIRDYDNTTILDFVDVSDLYGSGKSMIRTDDKSSLGYSGNGTDTDNCFADFKVLDTALPRPGSNGGSVHNIVTDEYFDTIQASIDDPDTLDGNTIEVSSGTYYENVVVNKSINLTGEDMGSTIIDGGGNGDVVYVTADWVNITGFKITNSGSISGPDYDAGIEIDSNYNNISDNRVISNCYGILIGTSSHNTIKGNEISNNQWGVRVGSSSNNSVLINNISSNNNGGVWVDFSDNITISSNNISNNSYGIRFSFSNGNFVFHNNFISNTNQAFDNTNMGNQWDNGYPSGGNFWNDYTGFDLFSGPNQNLPGNDGMGDTNYTIDSDSRDKYPLMAPIGDCIFLYEGWNLISLPFIQPDTNLANVLRSIEESYNLVHSYNVSDPSDPWKHKNVLKPVQMNDFGNIDHKNGFWIHITKPGGILFHYPGTQPVGNQEITLYPGWNLVGYPSLSNRNRTQGLNNIQYGFDIDSIWTYNRGSQNWMEMDDSPYFFEVGKGYWIHSKVTKTWIIPL